MSSQLADDEERPITWTPRGDSRLDAFLEWLRISQGLRFEGYRDLWRWSVEDISGFWGAIREYFSVIGDGFTGSALAVDVMPGAKWYPDARVNFSENLLRFARDETMAGVVAITSVDEDDSTSTLTWHELEAQVAALADALRDLGIQEGDRVAAVLPNISEAVVGLLAAASIGAIWSSSSPDLAVDAALSRLKQLNPRVLFGVTGYRYNGKQIDRSEHLVELEAGLPTVEHTILVRTAPERAAALPARSRHLFDELVAQPAASRYLRVPFDHPLWVLFSSGTTGAPKGIVHGHGGMLLEALKQMGLNQNLGPGDVFYVAANTSWMVWNSLVNTLATGSSILCYPGSPTYGRKDRQFQIVAQNHVTMFGTGAAYLSLVEKAGLTPGADWDLSALRAIMSTASPLPDSTWSWVHQAVKHDVHLGSDSGGTDICSGFVGSNPLEPVRLGELQGPQLGVAVQAWDADGHRVIGEMGEMVILRPLPSMPLFFWGDDDGSRYHEAYFEGFPGVWTQGDWITETRNGGFIVHGRSDATINRNGIRFGSADLYSALLHVPEVRDGITFGLDLPDGGYYFPLYVALAEGVQLDDTLRDKLNTVIRRYASARHVPDEIIATPDIPVTHAGKKIEVQLKRLFAGVPAEKAISRHAIANPQSIDWYLDQARDFRARVESAAP
ncbi:acetoacetate--CoA ligase [soil metagenome]